jgi:outer membrane receptor for ferrienterochelin and colicins
MAFDRVALVALGMALAGAGGLQAQDAALVVRVTGASDRAAVAAARLVLLGAGRTTHADATGTAILAVPDWPDTLLVTAIGFAPQRVVLTEAPERALSVELVTAPVVLPDLVTTAGRRVQRVAEGTASVTVLDRKEIDITAAGGLDQAVAEVPGLQLDSRQPAGSTVQIRGLGDARVLVLVDGEPVPGAQLENRDLSRLSTADVDRIEITKGPTSLQHGSDALGGVINLVTRRAEGPLAVELSALAGDQGRRAGGISVSKGGPIAFRLTGGMREEERVAGLAQQGSALERVWDLRSTTQVQLRSDLSLRGDLNYYRTRQRWPVSATFNGFVDTWDAGGFLESVLQRPWGSLRTRVVAQRFEYQYRQAQGEQPIANSADVQRENYLRGLVGGTFGVGAHRVDAGIEAAMRDVSAPDRIAEKIGSDRQLDLYAQDSWSLGRMLLNGGARWSHNSRWGSTLTPSTGVAVEVTPRLRLTATAARGFRGPSVKELGWTFANIGAGYVIQGNPDLRPESSWSRSTGVSWAPTRGVLAEAEVYRNQLKNLIDFASTGFTPGGAIICTPRNVEEARTEGAEVTLRGTTGGWMAEAGYAYLHAIDLTTGIPLDRRAKHTARLRLSRRLPLLGGGQVDLTARYTGPAKSIGVDGAGGTTVSGTQEEFLSFDLQTSLNLWSGTSLSLGVDNLTDQQPAGWPGVNDRRVYVGLRTRVVP